MNEKYIKVSARPILVLTCFYIKWFTKDFRLRTIADLMNFFIGQNFELNCFIFIHLGANMVRFVYKQFCKKFLK